MYISNNSNSNIGMATVLQQQQQQQQTQTQKNLMKTLTNGSSSEANANHGKSWMWQNQFENATLNMQYGMKPQQHQHVAIHPTSHVIAANNTPSNYSHNNYHSQQHSALQTANSNNSSNNNNANSNNNSNNTSTTNNNNSNANNLPANPAAAAGATTTSAAGAGAAVAAEPEEEPEIDIMINNVVCSFSVRCHLNLREIAQNGFNVEYRRENGMVTMKLRRPYTTASIWSSGRITCTGATSEDQAKVAARRYARCLEKLGFRARFHNFRVVNVLGTCSMPWAIKIVNFSERYKKEASYEPELHPGVTYKLRVPKATLKIFSTGSITVTASCVANVQAAIEHIFPLVYEFRKERTPEEKLALLHKKGLAAANAANANRVDEEADDDVVDNLVETDDEIEETNDGEAVVNSHSSKVGGTGSSSSNSINVGQDINKLKGKRPFAQNSTPNMNQKKRLLNGGGYVSNAAAGNDIDEDADEPSDSENTFRYTEFDDPEDLIEGPDDEDDDDM